MYYKHRQKARGDPDNYIAIIIDGMDQNKTNIPHLLHVTKSSQNLWRLRTHLTGVLIHTKSPTGKLAFAFYDILQFPHDSNLIMNVLLEVLANMCSSGKPLPRVLYVQLDNCFRENKNKFVFSLCSLLVQRKIFQKVTADKCLLINNNNDYFRSQSKLFACWSYSRRCRPILF